MTALPRSVVLDPADLKDWLQGLADTMMQIHATEPTTGLAAWYPYVPQSVPPVWTRPRAA